MLIARRREISLVRLVPDDLVLFVGVGAGRACSGAQDRVRLVLELDLHGRRSPSSPSTIGHVRDTLQTARALGDVMRVLLSISLGVEVLSGVLLDMPFRFLGIQGNIAQLGPIQGIFGTRNLLGFVAVIALITFLIEYRTQSVRVGRLGRSRSCSPAGSRRSATPPPCWSSPSRVGLAVGALALVRHARPERPLGAAVDARRHRGRRG